MQRPACPPAARLQAHKPPTNAKRATAKPGDLLAAAVAARAGYAGRGGGADGSSGRGGGSAAAAAAGGPATAAGLSGAALQERRANWAKMGALALRDLGLEEVPAGAFDALPGVRNADLSQVAGHGVEPWTGLWGAPKPDTQRVSHVAGSGLHPGAGTPCTPPTPVTAPPPLAAAAPPPPSQNRLATLPSAVSQLAGLASLRLGDNCLANGGLPWGALASLRGLTALALDRNALTALPAALGGCSTLVRLSAAGNAIASVEPGALGPLGALRQLDLSGNALVALPDDVGAWAPGGGWVLGASGRRAGQAGLVPDATCSAVARVTPAGATQHAGTRAAAAARGSCAHCAQGRATCVPPSPGACGSLEDLDASSNQVAAIPATITALTRLHSLRLDNNRCGDAAGVRLRCVPRPLRVGHITSSCPKKQGAPSLPLSLLLFWPPRA